MNDLINSEKCLLQAMIASQLKVRLARMIFDFSESTTALERRADEKSPLNIALH
jgi:hypothetical protein